MDYRLATIWPRQQYTADKAEIIDVDVADPLSQIVVTYEPDNNPSGGDVTAHPAKCISKIELVDGSDVLFSLSGQEAQGIDFYHNEKVPPNILSYPNGIYSEMIFNMNFGRYLWDPLLAFDPKKFVNPQLKITIDIDGGGDESNDGYLTVLAHAFDQKTISPAGFLMAKRAKQYTLAGGGHEYTDLPLDYPYKQLFLMAQRYGTGPEYQIDEVKLSEDQDKKIPLNHTMFQILRHLASQYPAWEEWILASGTTAGMSLYCTPCYWPTFQSTQWRVTPVDAHQACYEGDGGRFKFKTLTGAPNCIINARGWAPHAIVPLLPKFGLDPASWYNVSKLGNLKLDVKGGSSVGTSQTAEILTQQYRKY